MSRRFVAIVAALTLAAVGSVTPRLAQAQPASVSDPSRERAQVLLDEGNAALNAGAYVDALAKFRAAHEIFPSPKLLLNIGTTLRQLGRNAEAATIYEQYLAHPEHDPAREAELHALITQIDETVAFVLVRSRTPGSTVRLDGRILGMGPFDKRVRVEPGDHTVVAAKAGLRDGVVTLRLAARDRRTVDAEPVAPSVVREVVGSRGEAQRVAGFVVGGVGVLGLIAGAITGGLAVAREKEASENCSAADPSICDTDAVALGDEAKTFGTAATVLLVIGGAAAGAGLIVVLTAPSDDPSVRTPNPKVGAASFTVGVGAASLRVPW